MLDALEELRIIPFLDQRIADPGADGGPLPSPDFDAALGAVIDACETLAPTACSGRSGACGAATGAQDPTYLVGPYQSREERYIHVEVLKRVGLNADWVGAVAEALEGLPFWGVVVPNIAGGQLVIFANVVLVSASIYSEGADLRAVLAECRRNLTEL